MIAGTTTREHISSFIWQHLWLLVSLFVMTMGVALCVRSNLGSSVISTIPYVLALAGETGDVPALTIGEYTYVMNAVFVAIQVLALRRRFELVQLFQLVIGFFFGFLLDLNMELTASLAAFPVCEELPVQALVQLAGCTVLGIGIAFEVRCGSVTMPGEGITIAFSRLTGTPFPRTKIIIDTTLVVIAVLLGYVYFGRWLWDVTGFGTIFAMVYVGAVVKVVNPHLGWFDRVLGYIPGFRRYIYGLARFLYSSRP